MEEINEFNQKSHQLFLVIVETLKIEQMAKWLADRLR